MTQAVAQELLTSGAGAGRWELDNKASTVHIAHKTMWGMLTVKGAFTDVSGAGVIDATGGVTGELRIAAASIETKNRKRDAHLRSADLFDVEKHPEITVTITSAQVQRDGVTLQGDLTVKGVREPLPLAAEVSQAGSDTVTVVVEAEIDRNRFGISWNKMGALKGLTSVTVTAVFRRDAS